MSPKRIIEVFKTYPLAFICSLLIVACAVFLFMRGGVSEELSIQEADLTSRIRTIDENVKNANGIDKDVEDLESIVEQIDARLFDRDERAININFFYALEDDLDVVFSDISQLPTEDPVYAKGGPRELKLHSTLVFNIVVGGAFEEVLRFLYELHRVDPLIRVADFQIGDVGKLDQPDNVSARLRIIVLAEKD